MQAGGGSSSYFALCAAYLSAERLQPYRRPQDSDALDALARYCWNMALCESLYPMLQVLEVVLRNALHARLTALHGPTWYTATGVLDPREANEVAEAHTTLQRRHKPQTPGAVIAELTFGFWTSLFDRRYEQTLGRQLLQKTPASTRVFSYAGTQRQLPLLRRRLHTIRQLRNRVFHHEPIWYWSDLRQHHGELIETIRWHAPELYQGLAAMDRFPQVYRGGSQAYRPMLEAFCQQAGYAP
jgi:hypothetical protein